jgi:hypothetical protein
VKRLRRQQDEQHERKGQREFTSISKTTLFVIVKLIFILFSPNFILFPLSLVVAHISKLSPKSADKKHKMKSLLQIIMILLLLKNKD